MKAKRTCVMCQVGVLVATAEHPVKSKVGSFTVHDQSSFVDKCDKCGETYIEAVALMGYENRAVTTVLLDAPERADGAVLRHARHTLGLTQAELAKLLGLTVTTIVRMEKSKTIEARVRTSILWYLNQARGGVNVRDLATARPKKRPSKSHVLKVRAA